MAWLEKRKHRDGTSRYRIRDKIDGKPITVVKNAGFWKEIAEERKKDYLKKKAAGDAVVGAAFITSLEQAKRGWLIDTTRSAKTVQIYEGAFKAFTDFAKATKIASFSKENLDEWRAAMEDGKLQWNKGKTWHRYAPTTIKIMLSSVKDFLRYCCRQDLVPYKLVQSIRIKKPPSTRRFLTRSEAAKMVKACRMEFWMQQGIRCKSPYANNRLRKIILFGLYTGMRVSEVLNARWTDVTKQEFLRRMPDGRIKSLMIYSLFIPKAKRHKQRTVALHPTIAKILGADKRIGKPQSMFPQWTLNGLSQARRRAVQRAGLDRVRFHDLRHSFVRNYLKSKAGSLAELREHTGHEDLASLDPYAHFANEDIAATIPNFRIQ